MGTDLGDDDTTYKDNSKSFTDVNILKKRASDIDDKFFLSLESFKMSFFRYVLNPKYSENQKMYNRDKDAIVDYENKSFLLDNDIQINFDKVKKLIKKQDDMNKAMLSKNKGHANKLKSGYGKDKSTAQMINDKEYEYRMAYMKCGSFIAGTLGLILFILHTYKTTYMK